MTYKLEKPSERPFVNTPILICVNALEGFFRRKMFQILEIHLMLLNFALEVNFGCEECGHFRFYFGVESFMRLGLPGRSLGSVSSEGSSSAGQNYLHETTHNVTVIENE